MEFTRRTNKKLRQKDIDLDGTKNTCLADNKVALSLPNRLAIGWTNGSSLTAPYLEMSGNQFGRLLVCLVEVEWKIKTIISALQRQIQTKMILLTFKGKFHVD